MPEEGRSGPEDKDSPAAGRARADHPHPGRAADVLQAIGSRRKAAIAAGLPPGFTGYLITDGYTGYQHLLTRLAGIQQCAAT